MSIKSLLVVMAAGLIASGQSTATGFERLDVSKDRLASYQLSDANRIADMDVDALKVDAEKLAAVTEGSFAGRATGWWAFERPVAIHYRMFENRAESAGGIVIVSGRTEGLALYYETIGDLLRNGWSVYIHDHRGQGFSSRLLEGKENQSRGYVDSFDYYVDDLRSFSDLVAAKRAGNPRPLFIMAHSMGGAVTSLLLQKQNGPYKAVVLVTPMHEPWAAGESQDRANQVADKYCDDIARPLAFSVPFVSESFAEGGDFDDQAKAAVGPDKFSISQDRKRLALNWQARAATCSGPSCGHLNAKVGGATKRWFNQACAASRQARGKAASEIGIPVLLLQGGDDRIVKPERQIEFCENVNVGKAARYCRGYVVEGGRHALLIEEDKYRQPVLVKMQDFFKCVGSGRTDCL
jgi:lysophospholipase